MPVIVGIDPGVAPTVCVLIEDRGKPLAIEFYENDETSYSVKVGRTDKRRPSAPLLTQALKDSLATLIVVEDVHSMPTQGVSSMFAFGFASGLIEGVAVALGKKVLKVSPQVWKKAYRLTASDHKAASRHVAANLVPHLADLFKRAKDHNRAEAFLIAYWARGKHGLA
jgi:crossover junction endodeoxyribonuclease RuvC